TWYDRETATTADNSLTKYYLGLATLAGGRLAAGPVRNLSGMSDPHCGYWPEAPRSQDDSESCQIQPQWAGNCQPEGVRDPPRVPRVFVWGAGADMSCPDQPHPCKTDGGKPKYGDYNANACPAGNIFVAWAPPPPPAGPQPKPDDDTEIQIYAVTVPADA